MGSAWGGGTGGVVEQKVYYETGAVATGTTTIDDDDSIPQNTEGDEYMTLAITPSNANNILKINVAVNGQSGAAGNSVVALFQDSTANALAASDQNIGVGETSIITFTHYMTAGTTNSTTFKVRAGCHSSGTYTFNGQASSRFLGGVMASSISITEYNPLGAG